MVDLGVVFLGDCGGDGTRVSGWICSYLCVVGDSEVQMTSVRGGVANSDISKVPFLMWWT